MARTPPLWIAGQHELQATVFVITQQLLHLASEGGGFNKFDEIVRHWRIPEVGSPRPFGARDDGAKG